MTIYMSTKVLPYVYMGIHRETNKFYIGSRTSKRMKLPPEQDLRQYKTSSAYVKPIFDQFDWFIIAEFFDRKDCYEFEQKLIYENWNNPLKLNKSYFNGNTSKLITSGNSIGDNWIIISPDNCISIINNLLLFCTNNKLIGSCMVRVSQGKCTNHKGWRCIKCDTNGVPYDEELYYKLLNMKIGNKWVFVNCFGEYFITENFKEFCIKNNLNINLMYAVARTDRYHYEKWRCSIYENDVNNLSPYNKENKNNNKLKFLHINGDIFLTSTIKEFSKYTNTSFHNVKRLISGDKLIHKGWVYWSKNDTELTVKNKFNICEDVNYIITSPYNVIYYSKNLKKFCRDNNLHPSAMYAVSNRKLTHYKGWKCVKS